ncbi:MAG TPA: sigma-70 family RNA polymerase sigma factor [Anaeromyxobacteraceae bacterium]|jgi:RNA polymerase sigma-70 factor (ECF subfamily)
MSLDEEVAALRKSGDLEQAATVAIRALGPEILGYLTAMVRDPSDASDVFSQFAEDLWRGLEGFRGDASLRTWAYRLARHAALRRERDPFRRRGERLETTQASAIAGSILASTVVRHELRAQQLARLRSRLDEGERTLLILRVDRGLSWGEVADVLAGEDGARPEEGALRKRFERLKDKLARAAREEGLID